MKKLGQHFLINRDKIKKIIGALKLQNGDLVIEIGPGHGELTNELRIKNYELRIIGIEKDAALAKFLKEKFTQDKNLKIIEGDALKILKSYILNLKSDYKVVGNIPYYITGYLFRTIGEFKNKPSLIVLLIQKEVAQRICAKPPKMNLLAASVQFWAEPKIIDYIPKKYFRPMPEVDSAIIKLIPNPLTLNVKPYYGLIRVLFKQPRKTILNNLTSSVNYQASGAGKEKIIKKLKKLNINPQARPQDLNIKQIKKLSSIYS